MKNFLKTLVIFIWASIAIGTTATALNATPGAFLSIVSVLNLAVNGFAIYKVAKGEWKFKKEEE